MNLLIKINPLCKFTLRNAFANIEGSCGRLVQNPEKILLPLNQSHILHKWLLSLVMLQASDLPQSWSINKQFVVKYFIVMSSYLNLKSNLWKNGVLKILLPIKQQESNFEKAVDSGKGWLSLHLTPFW